MKRTNPYISAESFEKDIKDFANKHHAHFSQHSDKLSQYFEMACYNLIVHYYEKCGYKLEAKNLKAGDFKYKCSPLGHLNNFSYFKASKTVEGEENEVFYIFHNATCQSFYDKMVFTSPDIVVSKSDIPGETNDHYETKMVLKFVKNKDLLTFCEAKQMVPFPELMITFIGTVSELKPTCLTVGEESNHIAPTLMMSRTMSKHCKRIKNSLEDRYFINFFSDLIDNPLSNVLSNLDGITTVSRKKTKTDET